MYHYTTENMQQEMGGDYRKTQKMISEMLFSSR